MKDRRFTFHAITFMNTNIASTGWAFPSVTFLPNKGHKPLVPNHPKVLDHAHVVFQIVSFIQLYESFARKLTTFVAEL